MTATFEFTDAATAEIERTKAFRVSLSVSNMVSRIVAAAMMVAALGLWLSTGADYEAELLLFKLGTSLFLAVLGVALYQHAAEARAPEVEFDQIRRELRLVKRQFGMQEVVYSKRFEELGDVQMQGSIVTIFDEEGAKIVELPVEDPKIYRLLRRALLKTDA